PAPPTPWCGRAPTPPPAGRPDGPGYGPGEPGRGPDRADYGVGAGQGWSRYCSLLVEDGAATQDGTAADRQRGRVIPPLLRVVGVQHRQGAVQPGRGVPDRERGRGAGAEDPVLVLPHRPPATAGVDGERSPNTNPLNKIMMAGGRPDRPPRVQWCHRREIGRASCREGAETTAGDVL